MGVHTISSDSLDNYTINKKENIELCLTKDDTRAPHADGKGMSFRKIAGTWSTPRIPDSGMMCPKYPVKRSDCTKQIL
jgi:hypothetical protein